MTFNALCNANLLPVSTRFIHILAFPIARCPSEERKRIGEMYHTSRSSNIRPSSAYQREESSLRR